jgi:ribose transport system substrate-binding protein
MPPESVVSVSSQSATSRKVVGSRRLLKLACLASAAVMVTACASEDGDIQATGSTSDDQLAAAEAAAEDASSKPTEIPQTSPLEAAPKKGGKVIFFENGSPVTAIIGDAVEEAARTLGWSYGDVSYEPANPATLQSALRTALSQKPTAVVVTGVSPDLYGKEPIDAYKKAGVPIIASGVCLTKEYEFPIVQGPAGCEQEKTVGKLVADWVTADSKGEAKILHAHLPIFPSYIAMKGGFEDEIKANCPGCSLKTISLTAEQLAAGQVVPTVVGTLRSNPDINYIVFDQAQNAAGLKSALDAAGIEDIKWGGRQGDEEAIGALKNGEDNAWTASSYPVLGYAAVDTALRSLEDAAGADANLFIPIQLLTKDSAGDVQAPYNEPRDALEQYKALWNVS